MKIKLKSLTFLNFKGVKSNHIEFNDETTITGDNATGKTTIFDALTWLLFGKDSTDRKDFEIKTLDENGVAIEKLDHEITGELIVDGTLVTLKRSLREKWVKKRGFETTEFTGNETVYFYDEVPMQQKEFQARVDAILNENIFKLITSPTAFNSLTWQKRREALIDLSGGISTVEILNQIEGAEPLLKIVHEGKSLDDYKKQIAASIKKSKEEIETIPARIDETTRSKPEVPVEGFEMIKSTVELKEKEVLKIDEQIQDKNKVFDTKSNELNEKKKTAIKISDEIEVLKKDAYKKTSDLLNLDSEKVSKITTELTSKKEIVKGYKTGLETLKSKSEGLKQQVVKLDEAMTEKRNLWTTENAKEIVFIETEFCCPTCKRDFEESKVDEKKIELTNNFNKTKTETLEKISAQGKTLSSEKTNIEKEISGLSSRIADGEKTIELVDKTIVDLEKELVEIETAKENTIVESLDDSYKKFLESSVEYKKLVDELDILKALIEKHSASSTISPDVEKLKADRLKLIAEIDGYKLELLKESLIENANKRINELSEQEKKLSQAIASNEKLQFIIEKFDKLKIETLEEKVNGKFKLVKFKMFEKQINGGESPTCVCTINGVPYQDANTASKINAGLDIINALCEFYNVTAPVFIDNRESVVSLIPCESQIINLVVKEGQKQLLIS